MVDDKGIVSTDGTSVLGADDGAGMWLLLEMIDAGVPSAYVFHRGEERGGAGSKFLAKTEAKWLQTFDRAVAFDRRGQWSVITEQGWGVCCSDAFGEALAEALSSDTLMFSIDDGGIYTDTSEYTHLIPECTNVSIGYEGEHTSSETVDFPYLIALRDQVIALDWEALPTVRDPAKVEDKWNTWSDKPTAYAPVDDLIDYLSEGGYGKVLNWVKDSETHDIAELIDELLWQRKEKAQDNSIDFTGEWE
jgi:hypothetical protein